MKKSSIVLLVLAAPLFSGCDATTRVVTEAALRRVASEVATNKAERKSLALSGDKAYVASLRPFDSSPGLIVFEPRAANDTMKWAALGAGCSRYLQVHVAGQGALGKTPLWGHVDDMRRRLKYPDLRLDASQARLAATPTGVTRVAVGSISGNAARLTLAYQLIDVASGKVVAITQCNAPAAAMPAQLPILARQMCAKLGVTKPDLPRRVALSSDELSFIGALRWKFQHGEKFGPGQEAQLKALAPKDALSGILAQRHCSYPDGKSWGQVATDLLKNAPNNALVAGEIGWIGASRWAQHAPQLAALSKKYPHNYLVSTANMTFARSQQARDVELKWAENSTRSSPKNPLPWIDLALAISNISDDIRQSRYSNQISFSEWNKLGSLYSRNYSVALKSTEVDPQCQYAWSQLSRAAAFGGDGVLAETALWKSLKLDPGNEEAYDWGIQLCMPKWGGDAASVLKMATFAASNAEKTHIDVNQISLGLTETNQHGAFRGILKTILAKDPVNVGALTELGSIYNYDDRNFGPAEALYKKALKLDPDYVRANIAYGDLKLVIQKKPKAAEVLYRRAVAAQPYKGENHAYLGRCLAEGGNKAAGIAEANKAKALGFHDPSHHVWGATGVSPT